PIACGCRRACAPASAPSTAAGGCPARSTCAQSIARALSGSGAARLGREPYPQRMRRAVVVKLGSSTLVDGRGRARRRVFDLVAADASQLIRAGTPVVVVSSGAIALGQGSLGRGDRPRRLAELQAASA